MGLWAALKGLQVVGFVRRNWKPILIGIVLMSVIGYVAILRVQKAGLEKDLAASELAVQRVTEINERNKATIKRQQENIAEERRLNAEFIEARKNTAASTDAAIQEMQNEPGATDRVSPHRDALAKRLRDLDQTN